MTLLVAMVRRSLWVVLIAAAGGAAYSWWRDQRDVDALDPPEWPPLAPVTPASPTADAPAPTGWVDALDDGSCPISHPIKANDKSGIFHVPGGRFYDRTKPERCYTDAEAATADGYRQAKN
ncbi:sunset domain-containing protein [Ilumatobacter coccineus]|uniref:Nuclease n=1 Tax=Ilumatobacter coccineus (strain NBRC 103263 / KCTC 29153 / YM16-304) TaxID=1313172 RepID=A0A6C7EAD5_ILUCY|nr:hypothetical protein [Ilumatobacter coccineus]BAN01588.1 hypothetical protein YM304_12740 [Ilumatobacter coccineus YM16-304]